jgi:hypothetical protein
MDQHLEEEIRPQTETAPLPQVTEAVFSDDAEAVTRVAKELKHEIRLRKRRRRTALFIAMPLFVPLLMILLWHYTGIGWNVVDLYFHYPGEWFAATILAVIVMCSWLLHTIFPAETKKALKSAANLEDIRLVGPLVELLKFEDAGIKRLAGETLIKLLPRLKASDAFLLNTTQRALLCKALMARVNAESFRIAILKAFEQVGDSTCLATVQRLADGEIANEAEARVRDAARECVPYLQARLEQEKAAQSLLRPSAAGHSSETLLHPVAASPTEPALLLRSTSELGNEGS